MACWFSFSLLKKNLASYVYDSMRARTVLFLKGISAAIFSLRSCTACARALAVHALARARGRPRRLGCSRSTRRQRRKVDKCRVADKKQTNQQTNTHYSFIGIDIYIPTILLSDKRKLINLSKQSSVNSQYLTT